MEETPYKQFIKVDENGFEIEPVLVQVIGDDGEPLEIPENLVPTYVGEEGFYKKKWDFESKEWVEGATLEEIEEIKRTAEENRIPSETEVLQAELDALREEKRLTDLALLELTEIILGGGA